MKLFIPEIGTKLILTEDWNFELILESRNGSLIDKYYNGYVSSIFNDEQILISQKLYDSLYSFMSSFVINNETWREDQKERLDKRNNMIIDSTEKITENFNVTLPKQTILQVDRIYIRKGKGMSDFSSVSFYATLPGEKKKIRFFAKLSNINEINCDLLE